MLYSNNDPRAVAVMEEDRLGNDDYDEPRICLYCDECGEAIYEDERYYEFFGRVMCDSCIEGHERTAEWRAYE